MMLDFWQLWFNLVQPKLPFSKGKFAVFVWNYRFRWHFFMTPSLIMPLLQETRSAVGSITMTIELPRDHTEGKEGVQLIGAKSVLEIGTLGGYSAIWFAQAGAKVGSIEINPKYREVAMENLKGLDIEIILGAASRCPP
jgi:hypothetical protein